MLQVDSLPAEPQGKPKNTGVGSLSADLPDPGIEPGSSALQVDSLPAEPQAKPTGLNPNNHQFTIDNCSSQLRT